MPGLGTVINVSLILLGGICGLMFGERLSDNCRDEALRKRYFETRVDMDVYNAKYLTEGFKESEGQPWIIQKAVGFRNQCLKKNMIQNLAR